MKVLVVEAGKKPEVREIQKGLEALQEAVGGYIEAVYPFDDSIGIICNEEGKLNGLPYNRALRDEDGKVYDCLCGTFVIAGVGYSDFCSLTDEQIKRYYKMYEKPDVFIHIGNGIMVV